MESTIQLDRRVMLPLRSMWERVDLTATESDVAYFYDLLNLGELLTKLVTSAMVASIDDREHNRYTLERNLLHADSLGDWVTGLDDTLVGVSALMMASAAQPHARQMTQNWHSNHTTWQRQAVTHLSEACKVIDEQFPGVPASASLRWWFSNFVWLRNRTRGHGSPLPGTCAAAAEPLSESLATISANLTALRIPCAAIRRNLSGKYRVVPLTQPDSQLEELTRSTIFGLTDGVYFSYGIPTFTPLCSADIDLRDVQIANGRFTATPRGVTYEVLSYTTDSRRRVDGTNYLRSVSQLPDSETHGYPNLEIVGETFTNLPLQSRGYVTRTQLESELRRLLNDSRHPVVSLVGRGGIGKTSLALKVLHDICHEEMFELILWFSARDIDLLAEGPKDVRPQVLTLSEIAREYVTLVSPYSMNLDDLSAEEKLARALTGHTDLGPVLFVIDNFETVRNPIEIYETLDGHIQLPNKILITSRHREFKADYPVEVSGMTRSEFDELTHALSIRLNIARLLTPAYLDNLYEETEGHPYIVKVMLGEVETQANIGKVRRVLATKDRMLDALFERSFETLAPGSQRVFLTLCNWRSLVTQLELEAALMRPDSEYFDASDAARQLERYSMIEIVMSEPDVPFLRVPEAARLFGKKKLGVSPLKPVVDVDTKILQSFGTVRTGDVRKGFGKRLDQIVYTIAQRASREEDVSSFIAMLEYIASVYPRAWLKIAGLRSEYPHLGNPMDALGAVERYLQEEPEDADAWRHLASVARACNDPYRELNAQYRLANLADAPFEDISNGAQCLNRHTRSNMRVGWEERQLMAQNLVELLNSRRSEANGTDFSRLAWLYLNYSKQKSNASDCVREGLLIDPGNRHLLNLKNRLELQ